MDRYLRLVTILLCLFSLPYIKGHAQTHGTPCPESRGDSSDFRNKLIDRFISANDAFFYTIVETKPVDAISETTYLNQRLNTKLFNKADCIDFRNFNVIHVFKKDSTSKKMDSLRLQICFVKADFSKAAIPGIRKAMKKFGDQKYFRSEMTIEFSWMIKDETLYIVFTGTPFAKKIGAYMEELNMGEWE